MAVPDLSSTHGLRDANPGSMSTNPMPDHPDGTLPRRIGEPRPSPRLCTRVGATLATISPYLRTKVYAAYRVLGGQRGRLNDHRRAVLSEAVFQVENDLEHRQPSHRQVQVLRSVRNRLYDDLGWNESQPGQRREVHHVA